jgi:4'-phosphopantetheinyl transferase
MAALELLWDPAPPALTLAADEVHVWSAALDLAEGWGQQMVGYLSPDEQARAGRFRSPRDRGRYIAGRGTLRALLGRYLQTEPRRIELAYGAHGKPALAGGLEGSGLAFNVAHAGGLAVYALARGRAIGIDVERVRPLPDAEPVAAGILSARELAAYRALPQAQRLEAFFNCWTRKEAYVKATGLGLAQPLNEVEVTSTPGKPARLLRLGGDSAAAARWTLAALVPAEGHVAAVAAEGPVRRLTCLRWDADGPG